MRILHAAAEVAPWCRSGGLGEVVAALPAAQHREGADVVRVVPLCRHAARHLDLDPMDLPMPGDSRLVKARGVTPDLYLVDAPGYFDRVDLYADEVGRPFPDDAARFAFFAEAVTAVTSSLPGPPPDVVHAHDWHTGLVPAAVDIPSVFTIHNLQYQGRFDNVELRGPSPRPKAVNFMREGITHATTVTTVSPRYAAEIQTSSFGEGLEELLGRRGVVGILNGLDIEEWDPGSDPYLAAPFGPDSLEAMVINRRALLEEVGLDASDEELVIGFVSRFAGQKGVDVMIDLVPRLTELGARLVVLGNGEPHLERAFQAAAEGEERAAVRIGWDTGLAHRIIAGSDVVAVPSRFEPCGLIQMQAMRYGTVPVAHAVGGLIDTVIDPGDEGLTAGRGTGILFRLLDPDTLVAALERAVLMRRNPAGWRRIRSRLMEIDWSWGRSARAYLDLYRSL